MSAAPTTLPRGTAEAPSERAPFPPALMERIGFLLTEHGLGYRFDG